MRPVVSVSYLIVDSENFHSLNDVTNFATTYCRYHCSQSAGHIGVSWIDCCEMLLHFISTEDSHYKNNHFYVAI